MATGQDVEADEDYKKNTIIIRQVIMLLQTQAREKDETTYTHFCHEINSTVNGR